MILRRHSPALSLFLLALATAATPAAANTVYKCTDANGKIQFVDQPCNSGATQENVEIKAGPATEGRIWERGGVHPYNSGVLVGFWCLNSKGRKVSDGGGIMLCDKEQKRCQRGQFPERNEPFGSVSEIATQTCMKNARSWPAGYR